MTSGGDIPVYGYLRISTLKGGLSRTKCGRLGRVAVHAHRNALRSRMSAIRGPTR